MSFREKAQIVVASVAIALVLAAGFLYVTGRITSPTEPLRPGVVGGTDDAPILIAGGSLYFGTDVPASFTPNANKDTLYYTTGYKVYRIDATDLNDVTAPYTVTSKATIVISYCKNANNCNEKDEVTVQVDNSQDPAVTITNSSRNIGKAPRLLPNLWVHPRKNWDVAIVKLTVDQMTKPDVVCRDSGNGRESECNIEIQTKTP